MGEKFISGKIVSLDDEKIEKLDKMSKSLREIEENIKESILTDVKQEENMSTLPNDGSDKLLESDL